MPEPLRYVNLFIVPSSGSMSMMVGRLEFDIPNTDSDWPLLAIWQPVMFLIATLSL